MVRLTGRHTRRIIAHRPSSHPVADLLPSVASDPYLAEVEAATNPRLQQAIGIGHKVRPEDIGRAEPLVLASFAYSEPSRFSDGTFGVYYAAYNLETAIAESRFHTELFLRATQTPPTTIFKRVLTASVHGNYENLLNEPASAPLFDPDPTHYAAAQVHARDLYIANAADGIIYVSVRDRRGRCVAAFRPRLVHLVNADHYLTFVYDGLAIDTVFEARLHPNR